MKKFSSFLVAIIILAGILAVACSSSTSPSPSSTATIPPVTTTTSPSTITSGTTPPAGPAISITEPSSGNKFSIGSVPVSVQVSGFNLVDKIGQSNAAGEGHLIYYMDVDPPTMAGMTAATTPGTFAAVTDTTFTWDNVNSGSHKFSVQLVNNDNSPLNPAVTASVTLLVIPEIGPPLAVIVSPRTNGVVTSSGVTVTAQATNFNLVDKIGQANVSREGHLIYYMDVPPPTAQGQPATTSGSSSATAADSYTWQNVTAGVHKFYIQLVNNDNTPLDPTVTAQISITLKPPLSSTTPATTPITTQTSTPTATPTASTTPASTGQAVTVDLTAQNIAFDKRSITVPAGAKVTVNFTNKDNVPHNLAVYTDSSAATTIFKGDIITNSGITYTFTAPGTPGTYFFRCDVHPNAMTGSFVVQ